MKGRVDRLVLKKINLEKLHYNFKHKPLVVGGIAMEYYRLRKAGEDIDVILNKEYHKALIRKYKTEKDIWKKENKTEYKQKPEFVNLFGDKGVLIYEFEVWDRIGYDYNFLSQGAIEEKEVLIISIDKLLVMKALAINKENFVKLLKVLCEKFETTKFCSFRSCKF